MDYWHTESIPEIQPEEQRPGLRRLLIDILETLIISFVLFLGINAISERIRVESVSMEPLLYAGDFVLVNKAVYFFDKVPQRGDIVVFRYPPDPEATPYIKRVIGLPGDQVRIAATQVFVNGELMDEPYLREPTARGGEWIVPGNQLFVMGDNRNNSSDSRSWGFVPLENLIGRAELIYWPPEDWAMLHNNAALAASSP